MEPETRQNVLKSRDSDEEELARWFPKATAPLRLPLGEKTTTRAFREFQGWQRCRPSRLANGDPNTVDFDNVAEFIVAFETNASRTETAALPRRSPPADRLQLDLSRRLP